jgi:hypothetical protein
MAHPVWETVLPRHLYLPVLVHRLVGGRRVHKLG